MLLINDASSNELDVKLNFFVYDSKLFPTYDLRDSKSDLATAVDRLYDWSCTFKIKKTNENVFTISAKNQNLDLHVPNNHVFVLVNSILD